MHIGGKIMQRLNYKPLIYKGMKTIELIAWRLVNGKKEDVKTYVSLDLKLDIKKAKESFKEMLRKANINFDGVDVVK